MTQVTTEDIQRIIDGEPVQIEAIYPLDDQETDFKWFMRQPTDWLDDMADAVRQSAVAQVLGMPEMAGAKTLPPTDEWISNQKEVIAANRKRIKELEAIEVRTVEQDVELATAKDLDIRYIRPEKYSRAEQIAREKGNSAYSDYLVPRLVVDGRGNLLFDPNTKEGRQRWNRLRERDKSILSGTLSYLLALADIAKNSKAGQSSS